MKFYTNITRHGNQILVRGLNNGKPVKFATKYKPYLFIPSQTQTEYRNLRDEYVGRMDFDSMRDAREFLQTYEDVSGMEIFGLTDWPYMYIYDNYPGEIRYDPSLVSVCSIDIETSIENGFPDIELAENEITAITIGRNGKKTVFGCGDYKEHLPNVQYYKCADESALLLAFLEVWNGSLYSPDVVTGWNIEFFDIPYLVNRIRKLLGEDQARRLSPWEILREYKVEIRGRTNVAYTPVGIAVLDYIHLYKKFTYTEQESYRLDYIAQVELGEQKLDYSEYDNLDDLRFKNFQKYIEYNIHDVELVEKLEDKLKLIELVYAMAYDAKVNYEDCLASVKQWDIITHNYLLDRKTVVYQNNKNKNDRPFVGGYVKDPKLGMSKWVVSFDLNSLYPHLIMQYNISPETLVTRLGDKMTIDDLLVGGVSKYENDMKNSNCTLAANLCVYTKEKRGFLPSLMDRMYNDRTKYKKEMIEVKKEYEKTKDPKLVKEIARLDNMQMAKKIQLNSAYGALGNKFFRWYRNEFAEAITSSGQLTTRWIEIKLNQYLNKTFKTEGVDYVIACDTDSVYIKADKFIGLAGKEMTKEQEVEYLDKVCVKVLEPYIDKCYQELCDLVNGFDQKMKMKRECIADKGIWTAKKRYILNVYNQEGVAYAKPKLKMMGIEAIRTSTPQVCRDAIKNALEVIMNSTEKDLQKYIQDFRDEFSTLSFEQVASPRSVKDLDKYVDRSSIFQKGTPINVKGALIYNHYLQQYKLDKKYEAINSGQKIKYAYCITPNPLHCSVIACPSELPKEFGMDRYIDRNMQFDKAFLEPIKTITGAIGWEVEHKATLMDFFN